MKAIGSCRIAVGGVLQKDNNGTAQHQDAPDTAARNAGKLLVLTAIVTLVAVAGRVAADADRETIQETLEAIADNRFFYGLSGAGRLASGVTLAAGAWYLSRTWIIRERHATPIVPALFAASGLLTAISGLSAVLLAATLPASGESVNSIYEAMDGLHWLAGVAGFSAAGLALVVASPYQFRVGGKLRIIAPVSAVLGGTMQLIWIQDLISVHQLTGSAFFIWLLLVGVMLATGRVEEQYRAFARLKAH